MIPAPAAVARSIKTAAGAKHKDGLKFINERVRRLLEFDEFKLELDKHKGALEELGESL